MQEDRLQFMRCFMRNSDCYFTRPLQNTQPQSTNDYQVKQTISNSMSMAFHIMMVTPLTL